MAKPDEVLKCIEKGCAGVMRWTRLFEPFRDENGVLKWARCDKCGASRRLRIMPLLPDVDPPVRRGEYLED